eukprot:2380272-Rhodomonas_salina.2
MVCGCLVATSKDIAQIVPTDDSAMNIIAEQWFCEPPPTTCGGRQADALIDVYYYSLNAAAKKGMNISAVFDIVHAANMAKRDPATGKFIKRDDGKIIKPDGWKVRCCLFCKAQLQSAPDVEAEISRQLEEGAWPEGGAAMTDAAQVHTRPLQNNTDMCHSASFSLDYPSRYVPPPLYLQLRAPQLMCISACAHHLFDVELSSLTQAPRSRVAGAR